MNNSIVRKALSENRVYLYELAEELGISEATMSRKMRLEMPEEEQSRLVSIIKSIREGAIKNDI